MRTRAPTLLLVLLSACGARSTPRASLFPADPASAATTSPDVATGDVFAALKARDGTKLAALLAANPSLAGARRSDGTSAILTALFTLNADDETFVKPPENTLLRALVERHPRLDVYDAAATGDLERMRLLISRDPALANAPHPALGLSPLHVAAFAGNGDAVRFLLANGARIELQSRNSFHNTPLILSVLSDQLDAASALLTNGANVEATEEEGVRPIHLAAELGDPHLLALLLDHGATLDAKTNDGKTALAIATARKHVEAAALLRERGAR